jgi:hypothetical protein
MAKQDLLDNAINDLQELLENKNTGIGVIKLDDFDIPVAEFYGSLKQAQEQGYTRNLSMVKVEDKLPNNIIRSACLIRMKVIRDETQ